MLPFGSLLTQLPLIIIGALYMLYLGFYAFNLTKEAPLASDTEKKEQIIERTTEIIYTDYFTLVSLSPEKETDPCLANTIYFIATCSYLSYQVSDIKIVNSCHGYCLFSRPPPAFA